MKWGMMVLVLACQSVSAQFYFYNEKYLDQPLLIDIGLHGGLMNCLTDLGGGNQSGKPGDVEWRNSRPAIGLHVGARWQQRIGATLSINYGSITAADSLLVGQGGDARYRYQRNLHFRSRIFEALLCGSVYPISLINQETIPTVSPYLFGGIGLFHFDPQAWLLNSWTSLAPLRTEGNDPSNFYNRWQINFPVGIGITYEIGARLTVNLEATYRILRTDYLDDVSTSFIDPGMASLSPDHLRLLDALYQLSTIRDGPDISHPGSIRGNPLKRDSYFSLQTAVCWIINRQRAR